jgi:hypothetical protein
MSKPTPDSPDHEHRIRIRAYHLWEQDGRPDGQADEYWERARILTGIAESTGAAQLPNPQTTNPQTTNPQTTPPRVTADGTPIEEAALEENLGEFPGLQTDQGERQPTPAPRRRSPRRAGPG